jgi:hypothetical protein
VIQAEVTYRRKAYMHLTGGLIRMTDKLSKATGMLGGVKNDIKETDRLHSQRLKSIVRMQRGMVEARKDYLNKTEDTIKEGVEKIERSRAQSSQGPRTKGERELMNIVDEMQFINYQPLQRDLTKKYFVVADSVTQE